MNWKKLFAGVLFLFTIGFGSVTYAYAGISSMTVNGYTVTLTCDAPSNYTCQWYFYTESGANLGALWGHSVTYSFNSAGTYNIVLSVFNNGVLDAHDFTNVIVPSPAYVGISSVTEDNYTVTLECDAPNNYTCQWYFYSDSGAQLGSNANGHSVTRTFSSAGTYLVKLWFLKDGYLLTNEYFTNVTVPSSRFNYGGAIFPSVYGSWYAAGNRIHIIDFKFNANDAATQHILLGPQSDGKWYLLKNNGGGSFADMGNVFTGYGNWSNAANRIRVIDYDADGKQDILLGPQSNGNWYAIKNNGDGSFTDMGIVFVGYGNWYNATDRIKVIDYDADGKQDILLGPQSNGNWYAIKNNGDGSFANMGIVFVGYGNWYTAGNRIRVIDYNADGKQDILLGPQSDGRWYAIKNNGGTFADMGNVFTGYGNWYNAANRIRVIDYNADGKQDILLGPQSNGKWYGLRWFPSNSTFGDVGEIFSGYGEWYNAADRIKVIDYDADGRPDVLLGPQSNGKWYGMRQNP